MSSEEISELWRYAEELANHDDCNELHLKHANADGSVWFAGIFVRTECGAEGYIFTNYDICPMDCARELMQAWRDDNVLRPEYFVWPQEGYR